MGFSFSNGDVMRGVFFCIYHVGYEEFVGFVVFGGWISNVVQKKAYFVETIGEMNVLYKQ